ncbi:MAG: SDR family oxidoreductase [Gammaproteobacteria bacterium]|jgi:NAD(P)-dependent dehydrogenase (short-subunit alcohol dehydrogenase family)|nr:SDR family oxidoreductase [Gammaproteobacteria bacterium]
MAADMFDLSGKVALITGASRGIGEATARLLARHGARVVVASRKLDACEKVAADIRKQGGDAVAMACHIGAMDQIEALFAGIDEKFGRLDILVNNAAANPYYGHILDTDLAAFDKTVEVNIRGYFFMSIEAGKRMRKQGGGAIVNVASVNGVRPGPMQGIYSITKAAVINMTQSFAKECGQFNIRVNALLPGLTRTKFASALTENEQARDYYLKFVPLGRMAEPEEMAGSVLFLVSDASSYTTGSCITADGGYLA